MTATETAEPTTALHKVLGALAVREALREVDAATLVYRRAWVQDKADADAPHVGWWMHADAAEAPRRNTS